MWNLKYNTYELIYERNRETQKTHLWLSREWVREVWTGSFGLADANY